MKFVIQRAERAEVQVDGVTVGRIGKGFLVLVGIGEEDTEELTAAVEEAFPDVDVEANFGGQPIYYCILSVE